MIPKGHWRARAADWALGTASTGTKQIGVDFLILDGEATGKHITWYGYFTEETFERTIESLQHCGWEGDDLSDLRGLDRNEVTIVVDHEQNQQTGEIRVRVQWVNRPGGVVMKDRMDEGSAKAFAQSMKGRILAMKQKQGGSGAGTTRQSPAPRRDTQPADAPTNDDIPF
jgi:hypothetical protein